MEQQQLKLFVLIYQHRIITIPDNNFTLIAPSNTEALGQILGYPSNGPTWQTLTSISRIQDNAQMCPKIEEKNGIMEIATKLQLQSQ